MIKYIKYIYLNNFFVGTGTIFLFNSLNLYIVYEILFKIINFGVRKSNYFAEYNEII